MRTLRAVVAVAVLLAGASVLAGVSRADEGTPKEVAEPTPRLEISWADRLLTLDVVAMDVREVFAAIRAETGAEITVYEGVAGKVTLRKERVPLEKAVDDLLAAVGQRNYLMVFDGGGLTKLSIVPKGTGGLSEAAKRVKVRGRLRPEGIYRESKGVYMDRNRRIVTGNLRTGKEIEYFPGEIVVTEKRPLYVKMRDEEYYAEFVARLENDHGLALINRTRMYDVEVFKFRVLNGRDVIDVMYEMAESGKGTGVISPNGLGPKSVEFPEEDYNVYRYITRKEEAECAQRGLAHNGCMMEKMPFLKWEKLREGAPLPFAYMEGLFLAGHYGDSVVSQQIGRAHDEGAIVLGAEGESYLFFPDVHGPKDTVEVWDRLRTQPAIWRPLNGEACRPNDDLYPDQWHLRQVRAEQGWELEAGDRGVHVAVVEQDFDGRHPDFAARLSPLSADCTQPGGDDPLSIGVGGLDDMVGDMPGHGSRVAGIVGAITNNARGVAGIAGGGCDASKGVTLLALQINSRPRPAERAFWYAAGLLFADGVEYDASEPESERPQDPARTTWQQSLMGGANHAWTDSPGGDYDDTVESTLTYWPRDLRGSQTLALRLSYRAKWALADGDLGFVETSDDDGVTWTVLGFLAGTSSQWQTESHDLTFPFPGVRPERFRIRFRLVGNGDGVTDDGISVDDVEIQIVDASSAHKPLAKVVNASFWLYGDPAYVLHALEAAYGKGVSLVYASGNGGTSLASWAQARQGLPTPAGIDEKILVVAATDRNDARWNDASAGSNYGGIIDVSAPGVEILSTEGEGSYTSLSSAGGLISGTSYAAPQVAGLAALLVSRHPNLTPAEVYARITGNADPLAASGMGAGRINAYSALRGQRDTQAPAKPTDAFLTPGPRDIRLTWSAATDDDAIGGYLVFRRVGDDTSCSGAETIGGGFCLLREVSAETRTLLDAAVSETGRYTYRLVAVDKAGNRSVPTAELGPAHATLQPEAPTGLLARGGNGGAKFTWTAPTTNADGSNLTDLAGFRVYWDTSAVPRNGAFVDVAGAGATSADLSLPNRPEKDTPYFVCVTALDEVGNESECSDRVPVEVLSARWVQPDGQGPAGSFTSIRDALAGAPNGTTVIVGEGTYEEGELEVGTSTIEWSPLDIWLRSERGPERTVIVAGHLVVGDLCRVVGFTFSGAGSSGALDLDFDEGVLVANNVFVANEVALQIGTANPGYSLEKVNRIYNNVFAGNGIGIEAVMNYAPTDIENNIFLGTHSDDVALDLEETGSTIVGHNDFFGPGSGVQIDVKGVTMGETYSCDPRFVDNYHLGAGSCAVDAGRASMTYQGRRWEDCKGIPGNSVTPDLGAYGGPFAYVDKNGNGLPDCEEPAGYSSSVALLANSPPRPITLTARSEDPAAVTFAVQALTAHGELTGVAPELTYAVEPGYVGGDGLTFTVANELGESEPEQVSIAVKASNAAPTAVERALTIPWQGSGTVVLEGLDADGDALTYAVGAPPPGMSVICLHPPECLVIADREPHGEVTFSYHANDGLDDGAPATVTVLVNSEPSLSFEAPVASAPPTASSSAFLKWTACDVDDHVLASLYYDRDGEGFDGVLIAGGLEETTSTLTWDTSGLPDGVYYVYGVVTDPWSTTRAYAPGPVIIDRTAPQVAAEPGGGLFAGPVAVTLSASEPAVTRYTTNGTTPDGESDIAEGPIVVSSSQTVRFFSVDAAGNAGSTVSEIYVIDTTPPTGSVIVNGGAPLTNSRALAVDLVFSDAESSVVAMRLSEDGVAWGGWQTPASSMTYTLSPGEGARRVYVQYRDAVGHDSPSYWDEIVLDTLPPMVSIAPLPNPLTGSTCTATGAREPGATVRVTADRAVGIGPVAYKDNEWSCTISGLSNGALSLTAVATDAAGNTGSCTAATSVNLNRPPTNIGLSVPRVSENAAPGTVVGTLSTTDPDVGNTFTYSLVAGTGGADNAYFSIAGDVLKVALSPSFEDRPVLNIRVRTTDGGGLWYEKVFTIDVLDVGAVDLDFDRDGRADLGSMALFSTGGSLTEVLRSSLGAWQVAFPNGCSRPVAGDFDGDERADAGCFDPANGTWTLARSTAGVWQGALGHPGTVPVVGDFDGDGRDDLGHYAATGGDWYLELSSGGVRVEHHLGFAGTVPVVGDFDCDGRDDLAAYYPKTGAWHFLKSVEGYSQVTFGAPKTIPVAGDFDGDCREDIGYYHPNTGMWYRRLGTGVSDQISLGYAGTEPVVGDFDGDGQDDIACHYSPSATWDVLRSSEGAWHKVFGLPGGVPLGGTLR